MRDPRFDVWAPFAKRLRVQVDGEIYDMVRSDESWWRPVGLPELPPEGAGHESDYGYLIDDDAHPYPDPRSRRQPGGVHGLSRTFDPNWYDWGDSEWRGRQLAGGVIYELHIGTFTPDGTLDSAIERLDHLVDLGVDFVEPMPVNAFNGDYGWGYDGAYWFAVHEPYGGPLAYQRFVDACHQRGLGVIQDVVYNHLGPSGNYLGKYGPYVANQHQTAWGDAVNLDGFDSDQVRRYITDNVLMWVRDFHVDGLRLDAVHALVDTRAVHILEEISMEVEAFSAHVGRPLTLIAESDMNAPRIIQPRVAGGYAITAQWSDDFHHAAHVTLTGEDDGYYEDFAETRGHGMGALKKVLTRGFFHDGAISTFRRRHHGRPLSPGTNAWRLVASTQNHDQIGNRARGDRLSEKLSADQLAVGATLLMCSPFTPMLFMGEEWGSTTPFQFFSSHPEAELAKSVSQGRIQEFSRMGWDESEIPDPQDPETFRRSKLEWMELDKPERAALLDVYRRLIALRKAHPELTSPWLRDVTAEYHVESRVFTFWRGDLEVVLNFSDETQHVALDVDVHWTEYRELPRILFATRDDVRVDGERATLPPYSAAVFGPTPE
ncbi:malto-oligosyltrehalose trehalohydrolase [Gulosibacter molinativorax]|uniref:Malto-oligosyltrehalose trehalohydrolase n=1 Tax=Gulosibacter molinativorax TaxID=256821 RepID=A0ABT7C9E2_9MICO|nr:malto-oligosyltrehalose trehalohydrolase [Gulosibacter molinativorax]MDJ1371841.1 malto-oligosyltrehalose trehalohydrolase [Gulosibacter molinativorax]QUY60787.1 Malto-oligosyltrehalose trehalohydrolase [Gulosibacter molinativorax]